ncbi:hypothetical protein J6U78_06025 [bacterium]|nr:hypothetical protein [bacterium]
MPKESKHIGGTGHKNLVIFIVEGPADELALKIAFQRLYDKIDQNIQVEFINVKGDITTEENTFNIENDLEDLLQSNRAILEQIKAYPERTLIIQIVDLDGVFIDNNLIVIDRKSVEQINDTIKYEDNRIACLSQSHRNYIVNTRNPDKRNNLIQLSIKNSIRLRKINHSVSYAMYYFSTNLEHFLPIRNPNYGSGKKEYAKFFAQTEYRIIEKFVSYFVNDPESATQRKMSREESWKFIRQRGTTNSLARGTNLDLLLKNLYLEASLANAIKAFEEQIIYSYEIGTKSGLCSIHQALYKDLAPLAGQTNINLTNIEKMPETDFASITQKFIEMLKTHPFSIGNGQAIRIWYDMMLKNKLSIIIAWDKIKVEKYLTAIERLSKTDQPLKSLLKDATTRKTDDKKVIIDGLKQSYCFEGFDPKTAISIS